MLAIIYLILGTIGGTIVVKLITENLIFTKRVNNFWFLISGGFLVGVLISGWLTYLGAYLFKETENPMLWGNLLTMVGISGGCLIIFIKKHWQLAKFDRKAIKNNRTEIALLIGLTIVSTFLMFNCFRIENGQIQVGLSVFSDFGPHLAMIRSFSYGKNFPSFYPHFPSDQLRYHFMFQFLAGNLEYLGLRLDWAFNLPSILSLTATLMLLYILAIQLTGKKLVGILTIIMFWLRSATAFFELIAKESSLNNLWQKIINNQTYIGNTPNESWGLWTIGVYANQRHFGFALGIMFLTLILFSGSIEFRRGIKEKNWLRRNWFSKKAWTIKSLKKAVGIGIILGLLTYWNAAVVIATLMVLATMAVFNKHKLEFVVVFFLTLVLSALQKFWFIGTHGKGINPEFLIGFLAENKSFGGIVNYYLKLFGIMPIIFAFGLLTGGKKLRIFGLVFLAPALMATLIKLTPDIPVGHKYIMVSVVLINIICANFIVKLIKAKKIIPIMCGIILLGEMTITGVVDWVTFFNLNKNDRAFKFQVNDEVVSWVRNNTKPNDIFLTDRFFFSPVLLAGRKIFYGWPYYAWSAGYDTLGREALVKQIYSGTNVDEVRLTLEENGITYVIIDNSNRQSDWHKVNEKLFDDNFQLVYRGNKLHMNMKVFKVD